jgi:hypothetical protein
VKTVIKAVLALLAKRVDSSMLSKALARLYTHSKQHENALDTYLYMQKSGIIDADASRITAEQAQVFQYIEEHNLYSHAARRVAEIVGVEAQRGIQLLLKHATRDTGDLHEIVKQLEPKPQLMHQYLRSLFDFGDGKGTHGLEQAPGYQNMPRDYHDKQVQLFADYEPERLEEFLRVSTYYNPDLALEICRKKPRNVEVVFLLGRQRRYKEALDMILDQLKDIDLAIKFVKERGDEDGGGLWELLIERGVKEPAFISKLLANLGSHINPLDVIDRIPTGMEIPDLRDKLVKIIHDYNLQTSLHRGCSKILRSDVVDLCGQHVRQKRRAQLYEPESGLSATEAPSHHRDGVLMAVDTRYFTSKGVRADSDAEEVRLSTSCSVVLWAGPASDSGFPLCRTRTQRPEALLVNDLVRIASTPALPTLSVAIQLYTCTRLILGACNPKTCAY